MGNHNLLTTVLQHINRARLGIDRRLKSEHRSQLPNTELVRCLDQIDSILADAMVAAAHEPAEAATEDEVWGCLTRRDLTGAAAAYYRQKERHA